MPLQIRVGGRQTGRTKWLIQEAHEADKRGEVAYIVCRSHQDAYRISKAADELGTPVRFPVTYDEFINSKAHGSFITQYLVDNAELLIQALAGPFPVTHMTITKEAENEGLSDY